MNTISAQIVSERLGFDVTIEVKALSYADSIAAQSLGSKTLRKHMADDEDIAMNLVVYRDVFPLCQTAKASFVNNNPELEAINNPTTAEEFMALPAMIVEKWYEVAIEANPFWVTAATMLENLMEGIAENDKTLLTDDSTDTSAPTQTQTPTK